MKTSSDDKLNFAPETKPASTSPKKGNPSLKSWKVMVIDDDPVMHEISHMVLKDASYQGRKIELIDGYSAKDATRLIKKHPDTAVLLLDVVMETDSAGLAVVKKIRQDLKNNLTRIILRTGQPGHAPEKEIITEYDINDYKEKADLTSQKLYTAIIASIRNYHDLTTIHRLNADRARLKGDIKARAEALVESNIKLTEKIEQHAKALEALRKSETYLAEAQRVADIGHWEWNLKTNEISLSHQAKKILGCDGKQAGPEIDTLLSLLPEQDRKNLEKCLQTTTRKKTPYQIEHRIPIPGRGLTIIQHRGEPLLDSEGNVSSIIATVQDITSQHKLTEEMRKLSGAIRQAADAVMITNKAGYIEYVNPAFEEMTGYKKNEILGKKPDLLKSGQQSKAFYERMWKTINKGGIFNDVVINRRRDGSLYYEEKTISPLKDETGEISHYIATGRDISERMEDQQRLFHLAHHDILTGLPNRALLQDRLSQVLAMAKRHRRFAAILFLDMDRFKLINDTLGHDVGDTLLKSIAERLLDCVRESDTVARLGGDEFAIILNDIKSKNDVTPVTEKVLAQLARPFVIEQYELFITTSIGITLFPDNGTDTQTLLKKADTAMYRAKALGKNNAQYYTDTDDSHAVEKLSLETALRQALKRNEFHLHYQPQIDLYTGRVLGVEALLRWNHKEYKDVSPMHFIPLLEETGLIIPVGEWAILTACHQINLWQQEGILDMRVAVNVSGHQFRLGNLTQCITEALQETGVAPQQLELEITEGMLIDNVTKTADLLKQLHDMGITISIDDFGTGYSSMGYLKNLPIDVLKIDRSFINDITRDPSDESIASGMIQLAHSLGLKVVAEGVETRDQLNILNQKGCDLVQGYLFSRPIPPKALAPTLRSQQAEWLSLLNPGNRSAKRIS